MGCRLVLLKLFTDALLLFGGFLGLPLLGACLLLRHSLGVSGSLFGVPALVARLLLFESRLVACALLLVPLGVPRLLFRVLAGVTCTLFFVLAVVSGGLLGELLRFTFRLREVLRVFACVDGHLCIDVQ